MSLYSIYCSPEHLLAPKISNNTYPPRDHLVVLANVFGLIFEDLIDEEEPNSQSEDCQTDLCPKPENECPNSLPPSKPE